MYNSYTYIAIQSMAFSVLDGLFSPSRLDGLKSQKKWINIKLKSVLLMI